MTILTRLSRQGVMPVRLLHVSKIMASDAPFQRVGPVPLPKTDPLRWKSEWTYGGRATDF